MFSLDGFSHCLGNIKVSRHNSFYSQLKMYIHVLLSQMALFSHLFDSKAHLNSELIDNPIT